MSRIATILVALIALAACETAPPPARLAQAGPRGAVTDARTVPTAAQLKAGYRLGPGDKLRIIVFEEENLSGEFQVDDMGAISMPLIGNVEIRNKTISQVESLLISRLRNGYLKDPRISIEILSYRPFYIHGEVEKGGEYPYKAGMSVLNAVAVAGGYTYRANNKVVYITRQGTAHEAQYPATQTTVVMPGDVIRVPERYF